MLEFRVQELAVLFAARADHRVDTYAAAAGHREIVLDGPPSFRMQAILAGTDERVKIAVVDRRFVERTRVAYVLRCIQDWN